MNAAAEATLMMLPPRLASRMWRAAACASSNGATRSTVTRSANCSTVSRSAGVVVDDAGVGDYDVEAAVALDGGVDQRRRRAADADVAGHGVAVAQ